MRMQHNLEQQIQACNTSGVSEEALREFSMMFKHFDKDKSGKLDHQEFKSCLRALGYDLPMVEEGQSDAEFEAILDSVDPNRSEFYIISPQNGPNGSVFYIISPENDYNLKAYRGNNNLIINFRDGHVSLQEYMVFMISRETENVQSAADVEQAFRALTTGEKPYITAQELYSVSHTFNYLENRLITGRNQIENSSKYCSNFDSYLLYNFRI